MLTKIKTWFLGLKTWQKVVVGFMAFSILVAPFSGGAETSAPGGDSGTAPQVTEMPAPTATEVTEPLPFEVPEWVDQGVARAYFDSFASIDPETNMGVPTFISLDFIEFEDDKYGVFIEIAASENLFGLKAACGVAERQAQTLFTSIMRNVPVDLESHQLDLIQILSMLEGSDDFGAPIWRTLKNTSLEGPDFRKIDWAQEGIESKVSWDKLGGTLSCDRYKD
jgi:hypothetical protein